MREPRPTWFNSSLARPSRSGAGTWFGNIAMATFSAAVSVGMRLKCWNTKPICSARIFVSSLSLNR
jgi:hypothetical protein